MTEPSLAQRVVVGVDTHKHNHVAVAIDALGRVLGSRSVRATEHEYGALHGWAQRLSADVVYGIEGTGSYGAGLSRHLEAKGCLVLEIRGPNRKLRRDRGKSDTIDAEAAARAVLSDTATILPKAGNDWVEQLRVLRVARRSAIQARTQTVNQMKALVLGAPPLLEDSLKPLSCAELIRRASRFRVVRLDDAASRCWTRRRRCSARRCWRQPATLAI